MLLSVLTLQKQTRYAVIILASLDLASAWLSRKGHNEKRSGYRAAAAVDGGYVR